MRPILLALLLAPAVRADSYIPDGSPPGATQWIVDQLADGQEVWATAGIPYWEIGYISNDFAREFRVLSIEVLGEEDNFLLSQLSLVDYFGYEYTAELRDGSLGVWELDDGFEYDIPSTQFPYAVPCCLKWGGGAFVDAPVFGVYKRGQWDHDGNFTPLPGDTNGDGFFTAVDYTIWRDTDGDVAIYEAWRQGVEFYRGAAPGVGPGPIPGTVPEPHTLLLAVFAMLAVAGFALR